MFGSDGTYVSHGGRHFDDVVASFIGDGFSERIWRVSCEAFFDYRTFLPCIYISRRVLLITR